MAKTRPTSDQLRFNSSANGESILDDYMEACEKGGRSVPDLLDELFNPSTGLLKPFLGLREDPLNPGDLQYRLGAFVDPDAGWLAVTYTPYAASYASEWADKDEDVLISTGAGGDGSTDYSAKHWAIKSAASADSFDDRYLGAKAANPTLDNDGDPLQDGATYWNTLATNLRFYDLGTTTWYAGGGVVSVAAKVGIVTLTASTDLTDYSTLINTTGGQTITGDITVDKLNIAPSTGISQLIMSTDSGIQIILANTASPADEKNMLMTLGGEVFKMTWYDDAFTGNTDFMSVTRTLNVADAINFTTTDFNVSGRFSSIGIDDNATAKRLLISDTVAIWGASGSEYVIRHISDDASIRLSGGIAGNSGANIQLFGGSHSSTGDMVFLNGANTWMQWDESNGDLEILTGIGAKTTALTIDASQLSTFSGPVNIADEDGLSITALIPRFDIVDTDAGLDQGTFRQTASQLRILDDAKTNAYTYLQTTRSGTGAGIQVDTIDLTAVNDVTVNSALMVTGAFTSLGINDDATGTRLLITNTNVILGAVGVDATLNHIANDRLFQIAGGSAGSAGGNILLYGGAHATVANDMQFRAASNAWMVWDESNGDLEILTGSAVKTSALVLSATQGANFGNSSMILDSVNDVLQVGNGAAAAAAIYINSSATGNPLLRFTQNATIKAFIQYLDSGDIWAFDADGDISIRPSNSERVKISSTLMNLGPSGTADYGVSRVSNTGLLSIAGGNTAENGGNIQLWGSAHATFGGDFRLRSGTTSVIIWDESAGQLNFFTGSGGGQAARLTENQDLEIEGHIRMPEEANVGNPFAGYGRYWIRDDAPNVPMFTDDTDADHVLAYGGASPWTYTLQTGTTYTAVVGDFVVASNTLAVTITLPSGHSVDDTIIVKKIGSGTNAVTVDANASETIDGSLTFVMTVQYTSVTLISDGTNWLIV